MNTWESVLNAHLTLAQKLQADDCFSKAIKETAENMYHAVQNGGKILLFGNGGSAADAQHIAAEFVGRFRLNREAMDAIALTTNSSALTAIANDFDFEWVFARQVSALADAKDVVIGISTGGFSKNVIAGLLEAKKAGAYTVLLTGQNHAAESADTVIAVPSEDTPRIQEIHILVGHFLAEYVEKKTANDQTSEEK